MNQDNLYGVDTIVLGGYADDDTITLAGDDDQFSLPLTTTLGYNNTLSSTLATATTTGNITSSGTLSSSMISYGASGATVSVTGAGSYGQTLQTTTGGGIGWGNLTYNNSTYTATASPYTITANAMGWNQSIRVAGDAEFEGDIKIKGVNLTDRLDAIEQRLGILRPNEGLEEKWDKLRQLGEEYRKLEKEILDGESIWDILKK